MWFVNLYFSGAYIAALLFVLLLEIDSFRDYFDALIDVVKNEMEEPLAIHNYSLMMPVASLLACLSWFGVIMVIALVIDYIGYERSAKEE